LNRDALTATIIGFGIGLLIMGVLLIGPNLTLPNLNFFGSKGEEAPQQDAASQMLTIDSPLPEAIESTDEVLLSGKAAPHATIVISGVLGESVVSATAEGTWAGKADLTEGANELTVTMYAQGTQSSQMVTVYYTPEEF
jgi:hypothetical protein